MSTREKPTTILVSPELLVDVLCFPREAQVVSARWDDDRVAIELDVAVEGWPEGEICPLITETPRLRIWKHGEIELGRREMRP